MPAGFWKVYAKCMAVLFGMVAFAAAMNWAAYAIAGATGIGSGWVMLALVAAYVVIGLAAAAYGVTKGGAR